MAGSEANYSTPGAIPPPSLHAFTACIGTALPFKDETRKMLDTGLLKLVFKRHWPQRRTAPWWIYPPWARFWRRSRLSTLPSIRLYSRIISAVQWIDTFDIRWIYDGSKKCDILINVIQYLLYVTRSQCVFCEVRNTFLNLIKINLKHLNIRTLYFKGRTSPFLRSWIRLVVFTKCVTNSLFPPPKESKYISNRSE